MVAAQWVADRRNLEGRAERGLALGRGLEFGGGRNTMSAMPVAHHNDCDLWRGVVAQSQALLHSG